MGFSFSMIGPSPPVKIESVALRAPRSPPDTGASTAEQPAEVAAECISTASEGSEVVMSTMMPPGRKPERGPVDGWRITWPMSDG